MKAAEAMMPLSVRERTAYADKLREHKVDVAVSANEEFYRRRLKSVSIPTMLLP